MTKILTSLFFLLCLFAVLSSPVQAALRIPYSNDPYTLHLWHLDEPGGSSAQDAATKQPIMLTTTSSSKLGAPSFAGLGFANYSTNQTHVLYGGRFSNVAPFEDPVTGAFTFEAVVRFDADPKIFPAKIVSADDYPSPDGSEKAWSWGILDGMLYWGIFGSPLDVSRVPLPTTGPDAAIPGAWYHLAVTSTGPHPRSGESTNLMALYWTRLDPSRTEAHKLIEFTSPFPLDGSPVSSVKPVLGIGGGLLGAIDEVRISSVARKANEMAFAGKALLSPIPALLNTGVDDNGDVAAANGPDPHWVLFRSSDPAHLGPSAVVFENRPPLETSGSPDLLAGTNGFSMWIGPAGNAGGATILSPPGEYIYRTRFLVNPGDSALLQVSGRLWGTGFSITLRLNGNSLEVTRGPGYRLSPASFAITNGFVEGWNTLDIIQTLLVTDLAALRAEFESTGPLRAPGLPLIIEQPADEALRAGAAPALFSVAALARPPLIYQWFSDGFPIANATNRLLKLDTTAKPLGTNFLVVLRNDSGSVTSRVATLRLVSTNQPPLPASLNFVAFEGLPLSISLSQLVLSALDRDHDPIRFVSSESSSSNGGQIGQSNVTLAGTSIKYNPIPGPTGSDSFGYGITDGITPVRGLVAVQILKGPLDQSIPMGGTATLAATSAGPLGGYSFQWQLNGTNIPGGNASSLVIAKATLAEAGRYRVLVTNPGGETAASSAALLTVGQSGIDLGPPKTLSECSFAALEQAVQNGGNIILPCASPIYFEHPITIRTRVALAGSSRSALSGNRASRLFILEPGAYLSLKNILISDGYVTAEANPNTRSDQNAGTNVYGGAIWNQGGTLLLSNCVFNTSTIRGGDGGMGVGNPTSGGAGGKAYGGAIMSSNGVVQVDACVFASNQALGGNGGEAKDFPYPGPPGDAIGGAICQIGGELTVRETRFEGNGAVAGKYGPGNRRYAPVFLTEGGAVAAFSARVRISDCAFLTNSASDASARGGALYISGGPGASVVNSDFNANMAQGGEEFWQPVGNSAGYGGAIYLTNCPATFDSLFCSRNSAHGGLNRGGDGLGGTTSSPVTYGGAIYSAANLTLRNSTFFTNTCIGTSVSTAVSWSAFGGAAYGGALYNAGTLLAENNTFSLNTAQAGTQLSRIFPGDQPALRSGAGGAFLNSGTSTVVHCTFAANSAVAFWTNSQHIPAVGGSIANIGTANLRLGQSILAYSSTNNYSGSIVDAGENMSSDATPTFSAASSRNNIDPLLAPLRYNRGPTPTMALKPGSPAIDSATPSLLYPTDQRGEPRPFGRASDIGAYEVTATPIENVLEASAQGADLDLVFFGTPSQAYEILSSTNLISWSTFNTSTLDELGRVRLNVPLSPLRGTRVFKARQVP